MALALGGWRDGSKDFNTAQWGRYLYILEEALAAAFSQPERRKIYKYLPHCAVLKSLLPSRHPPRARAILARPSLSYLKTETFAAPSKAGCPAQKLLEGSKTMRLCDLKQKEVINTCDCRRLGFISDLIFDIETGCLEALIVPGPGHICYFLGRDSEYIIPFSKICQIGEDIVLVDIDLEKCLEKCKY